MKKQLFIFSVLLLMMSSSFAQKGRIENLPSFDKPKFHYGFYLGLNRNDFKLDYRPTNAITGSPNIIVEPSIGFNVGLIADYRLHKNINLRFEPGLMTNTKTITFFHIGDGTGSQSVREDVGSTFLHMPLILKFSTDRMDNVRPYVLGGISFDHNFSSNEDNADDNSSGEFRMKSSNFMYEVGVGIDIYLNFFKFSPSIRGVFAINDELVRDNNPNSPWTAPINYMGTRGIFLHFAFE